MSESLRDQLNKAFDQHTAETPTETPAPEATSETVAAETPAPEKPGRTAGRARDEKGRLLPGPAVRPESAAEPKAPPAQDPNAQATVEAPAAETKPRPQRPSSWKKEYWDHWDKLDPSLAEYLHQRESEFAKGVSTYKNEFDRAKPLVDAVAPYLEDLKRAGVEPSAQIRRYFDVHRTLLYGTPDQKLSTFLNLAHQYQVPVQNLLVRGQDGQVFFNPQLMQQQAPQQQQPGLSVEEIEKRLEAKIAEREMLKQIEAMGADKQKYPHFEVLRETMAGLLQSGLAQDLPSAYEAAKRMPAHSDIWDAEQKQLRETQEKEKAEAQRKAVESAKRNAVSPKSQTPAGAQSAPAKKGLRSNLESAYEEVMGSRV